MLKSDWSVERTDDPDAPFGPNGGAVDACLQRARAFTRAEILWLDLRERHDPDLLLAGWDHCRDRLQEDHRPDRRSAARTAGWAAVGDAARRLGLPVPPDDGYWRVGLGPAYGAARVTRYVATALVEPAALDPEWLTTILEPWRDLIGDPLAPRVVS